MTTTAPLKLSYSAKQTNKKINLLIAKVLLVNPVTFGIMLPSVLRDLIQEGNYWTELNFYMVGFFFLTTPIFLFAVLHLLLNKEEYTLRPNSIDKQYKFLGWIHHRQSIPISPAGHILRREEEEVDINAHSLRPQKSLISTSNTTELSYSLYYIGEQGSKLILKTTRARYWTNLSEQLHNYYSNQDISIRDIDNQPINPESFKLTDESPKFDKEICNMLCAFSSFFFLSCISITVMSCGFIYLQWNESMISSLIAFIVATISAVLAVLIQRKYNKVRRERLSQITEQNNNLPNLPNLPNLWTATCRSYAVVCLMVALVFSASAQNINYLSIIFAISSISLFTLAQYIKKHH